MAIGFSSGPRDVREQGTQRNVRGKKTRNPGFDAGNHWVQCDRCAAAIRSRDARITWDNLVVCPDDWEIRHPQDFVRGRYDDIQAKEPRRSESPDTFVEDEGGVVPPPPQTEFYQLPAVDSGINFDPTPAMTNNRYISIGKAGDKMYLFSTFSGGGLFEYDLPTKNDVSTAVLVTSVDNGTIESEIGNDTGTGITFSGDGTAMFLQGDGDSTWEFPLSTAWSIASRGTGTKHFLSGFTTSFDNKFDPTGMMFYFTTEEISSGFEVIAQYNLGTAYDLTSLSSTVTFDLTNEMSNASGVAFSSDGNRMYVLELIPGVVYQYDLGTPYDVTTAVFSTMTSNLGSNNRSMDVTDDGSKLIANSWISSGGVRFVTQFDLTLIPT